MSLRRPCSARNIHVPVPFWGISNFKKSPETSGWLRGHRTQPNQLLWQEHTSTSQHNSHLMRKLILALVGAEELQSRALGAKQGMGTGRKDWNQQNPLSISIQKLPVRHFAAATNKILQPLGYCYKREMCHLSWGYKTQPQAGEVNFSCYKL